MTYWGLSCVFGVHLVYMLGFCVFDLLWLHGPGWLVILVLAGTRVV